MLARPIPSMALAVLWCSLAARAALSAPDPAPVRAGAFAPEAAAADADSAAAHAELAPSSEPPWNPPRPVPDAEPWETALRLPGRIVSLPLSAIGYVSRAGLLRVEQDYLVPKTLFLLFAPTKAGLEFGAASLGDRTGFGVSVAAAPRALRRVALAEWSGSTLRYTRARLRLGNERAGIEYRSDWRPADRFFGLGLASSMFDTSRYAVRTESFAMRARVALGPRGSALRDRDHLEVWSGVRRLTASRGRGDEESPSIEARFPQLATELDRATSHVRSGARLSSDWRFGRPHWARGGRAALGYERFDALDPSFLFPATPGAATFSRWTLEAEGGLSFMRDPRTFRLALRAVNTVADDPAPGAALPPRFPIADLVTLGGEAGLEGFEPGRFHGLDALVGRLTYLFPLAQHYEVDVHVEQGGVYRDLFEEPRLAGLRTSYGVALRPRTDRAPLGAIGVEWSNEAVRMRFTLGGVE